MSALTLAHVAGAVLGAVVVGLALYGVMELAMSWTTMRRYRHGPPALARASGSLA